MRSRTAPLAKRYDIQACTSSPKQFCSNWFFDKYCVPCLLSRHVLFAAINVSLKQKTSKMLTVKQWKHVTGWFNVFDGVMRKWSLLHADKVHEDVIDLWPSEYPARQVCESSASGARSWNTYCAVWMLLKDRFSEKLRDIPMGIPIDLLFRARIDGPYFFDSFYQYYIKAIHWSFYTHELF